MQKERFKQPDNSSNWNWQNDVFAAWRGTGRECGEWEKSIKSLTLKSVYVIELYFIHCKIDDKCVLSLSIDGADH
jgi:hypothetical protein